MIRGKGCEGTHLVNVDQNQKVVLLEINTVIVANKGRDFLDNLIPFQCGVISNSWPNRKLEALQSDLMSDSMSRIDASW